MKVFAGERHNGKLVTLGAACILHYHREMKLYLNFFESKSGTFKIYCTCSCENRTMSSTINY